MTTVTYRYTANCCVRGLRPDFWGEDHVFERKWLYTRMEAVEEAYRVLDELYHHRSNMDVLAVKVEKVSVEETAFLEPVCS